MGFFPLENHFNLHVIYLPRLLDCKELADENQSCFKYSIYSHTTINVSINKNNNLTGKLASSSTLCKYLLTFFS